MQNLQPFFQNLKPEWTGRVPLPGGAFPVDGVAALKAGLKADYPFLDAFTLTRMMRSYGTETRAILAGAGSYRDLGQDFGERLSEAEVRWLMKHEFAQTAEDVVWRRGKLGLKMNDQQVTSLDDWMQAVL